MMGADVQVVFSGEEALNALAACRPDLVLLDIGMPGMNGHEVARRIRQRPEFHDLTLVALTGWGQQEDRWRSREAGFDHHLIKPAGVAALKSLIESLPPPAADAVAASLPATQA
jgi:CheY-like chemotaxis protein